MLSLDNVVGIFDSTSILKESREHHILNYISCCKVIHHISVIDLVNVMKPYEVDVAFSVNIIRRKMEEQVIDFDTCPVCFRIYVALIGLGLVFLLSVLFWFLFFAGMQVVKVRVKSK